MKQDEIRKALMEGYSKIGGVCCGHENFGSGCADARQEISKHKGYSEREMETVPEGANLGLGCGNPTALASLKEGEVVLDLGSGAGFDCFLAADKVGESGKVIGVDMTPEMIDKARENAKKGNYSNVEFRLGEIENLPVADDSVDVVISNCVINLSPDKRKVFVEGVRVLRPGGRLVISDIVLLKKLPDSIQDSIEAYIGCVAGAMMKDEYIDAIQSAGFHDVKIIDDTSFPIEAMANDPIAKAIIKDLQINPETTAEVAGSVRSIKVQGVAPLRETSAGAEKA